MVFFYVSITIVPIHHDWEACCAKLCNTAGFHFSTGIHNCPYGMHLCKENLKCCHIAVMLSPVPDRQSELFLSAAFMALCNPRQLSNPVNVQQAPHPAFSQLSPKSSKHLVPIVRFCSL